MTHMQPGRALALARVALDSLPRHGAADGRCLGSLVPGGDNPVRNAAPHRPTKTGAHRVRAPAC